MAETKITIAGEIYDLNKELKHSTPYNRKKSIQIMLNGIGSAKGYTKAELKEIRTYLLKEKALNEAGQKKTLVKKPTYKATPKRTVKSVKSKSVSKHPKEKQINKKFK